MFPAVLWWKSPRFLLLVQLTICCTGHWVFFTPRCLCIRWDPETCGLLPQESSDAVFIISWIFEGELGLQLLFFKLNVSFSEEEEGKLLKSDPTAKGKKMPRVFENFSLTAFLVFSSAKGKGALLQNTVTVPENSSLFGLLTPGT